MLFASTYCKTFSHRPDPETPSPLKPEAIVGLIVNPVNSIVPAMAKSIPARLELNLPRSPAGALGLGFFLTVSSNELRFYHGFACVLLSSLGIRMSLQKSQGQNSFEGTIPGLHGIFLKRATMLRKRSFHHSSCGSCCKKDHGSNVRRCTSSICAFHSCHKFPKVLGSLLTPDSRALFINNTHGKPNLWKQPCGAA